MITKLFFLKGTRIGAVLNSDDNGDNVSHLQNGVYPTTNTYDPFVIEPYLRSREDWMKQKDSPKDVSITLPNGTTFDGLGSYYDQHQPFGMSQPPPYQPYGLPPAYSELSLASSRKEAQNNTNSINSHTSDSKI